MSRRAWIAVLSLVLVAIAAGGYAWWHADREARELTQRRSGERREREQRQRERQRRALRNESGRLMPDLVTGLYLGMSLRELRAIRTAATVAEGTAVPAEPSLAVWTEDFENGARGVYAFRGEPARLERVQIMSLLPNAEGIAPHLAAMNDRYGTPTQIWDCPDTGGVPTRRFTWRHGRTTVSDVFLIYGERVSLTFYVASNEVIARSLALGSCRPLTDRSQLERFPVASPAQMQADRPRVPSKLP